jgi:general secretion pathway protein M
MEQFKQWWESITSREQQLSLLSAILIVVAILYWGIWSPLASQLADNKQQLVNVKSSLSWTQEKANFLLQSGATQPKRSGNLTQILNRSASRKSITFSRIVNKQEQIEVWITNVEFDLFLQWLTDLKNQYGISVLNADLAKTDQQGYIKVNRLLLTQ